MKRTHWLVALLLISLAAVITKAQTWSPIGPAPIPIDPSEKGISAIGVSPQNDLVRIVGVRNGQVYATTTGSNTLANITSTNFPVSDFSQFGDAHPFITRAVIDPNNQNTAYVTFGGYVSGAHVWKTTNLSGAVGGSINWVEVFDLGIHNGGRILRAATAGRGGLSAAAVSSSQINLTWTDNSSDESSFKIERCTGAGCSNFAQVGTAGANATSFSDLTVAATTTYVYRVRAANSGGDSDPSNTAQATTPSGPPPPLAAPSNLVAGTISGTQINLSWTDNSGNENGFRLERCTGSTCTNFVQIVEVAANVTSFPNTGLTKNTTYRCRVRSFNASGNSAYSNIVSATTPKK